jgi:hypothetical protein
MVLVFNAHNDGGLKNSGYPKRSLPTLPVEFLRWLSESRTNLFEVMAQQGPGAVRTQPSHLAVMATFDGEHGKLNLATKGLGPVPRADRLERFTGEFKASCRKAELGPRIDAARSFYTDHGAFDPSLLGGLEIFEGRTYHNLLNDPRASLLFSGEAPGYTSYQLDGSVSIVGPGDPYYEFLVQARELFSPAPFHIAQKSYPVGYLFRPDVVTVKTPFSRR